MRSMHENRVQGRGDGCAAAVACSVPGGTARDFRRAEAGRQDAGVLHRLTLYWMGMDQPANGTILPAAREDAW